MGIRHVVRTRRAHVLVRDVGCAALPLSGTGGSSARWLALQSSNTGGPHALAPLEGVCGGAGTGGSMGIRHVVRTRRAHVLVRTVGCTALPLSGTGGSSARWLALQSSSTGGPHALAPLEGVCGEFYPSMNGSRRRYPADASAGGARMELPAEREPHHGRSSFPRRHPGDARPPSPRRHPGDAPPARSNMHVALLGHILAVQWCIGTCNYVHNIYLATTDQD